MRSKFLDGGAYSRTAFQAINKTATAAGSGDNTEVDGAWVSRDHASKGLAESAKLVITYTTALATGESLKFAVQMQDATASDGTGAADYGTAVALTAVATATGSPGETINGTAEVDIDLQAANEYIRAQITPDLTRGGTDTVEWSAAIVFYGSNREPSTGAFGTVGGVADVNV